MRVLLVNRYYGALDVPTGRMLYDVAFSLAKQGHEIQVLTTTDQYTRSIQKSDTLSQIKETHLWTGKSTPRSFRWLVFWIQACFSIPFRSWDRCIVLTDPPFLLIAAFFSKILRRKEREMYWWTMDLYPEAIVAKGILDRKSPVNRVLRKVNEIGLRYASGVICLGSCQMKRLQTYNTWRYHSDSFLIAPPWDNRSLPRVKRSENRLIAQHGWEDKRIILYAGNLGEAHSYEEVLEAARHLHNQKIQDWLFVFVIRGSKRTSLEQESYDLENVVVMDYLPPELTADLLWSADIHLITMQKGWEGIVVPSKLYGVLKTDAPVLFIGPTNADTAVAICQHSAGKVINPDCSAEEIISAIWKLEHEKRKDHSVIDQNGPVQIAEFITQHNDQRFTNLPGHHNDLEHIEHSKSV